MLSFIVLMRDPAHQPELEGLLHGEGITPCYFNGLVSMEPEELPKVYVFSYRSDTLQISSTLIRQKRKSAEQVDQFVHKEVKHIMEENKLYENRGL